MNLYVHCHLLNLEAAIFAASFYLTTISLQIPASQAPQLIHRQTRPPVPTTRVRCRLFAAAVYLVVNLFLSRLSLVQVNYYSFMTVIMCPAIHLFIPLNNNLLS